jgi:hypothetical protein
MLQSILVGQLGIRRRRHRVHVAVIKVVGDKWRCMNGIPARLRTVAQASMR